MKHLPNILSSLRIVGAVALLLNNVSNNLFWVLYIVCGISDIADGWLARKLKCVTRTGALLDSLADLCFVACCACQILPIFRLPQWLWLWAGNCRNQSCESAFGTRKLRVLLLPSHHGEQVDGIPAIHCSPHDIWVYCPHLNSCNRCHICCSTRGTFHKTERSLPNGEVASVGEAMKRIGLLKIKRLRLGAVLHFLNHPITWRVPMHILHGSSDQ